MQNKGRQASAETGACAGCVANDCKGAVYRQVICSGTHAAAEIKPQAVPSVLSSTAVTGPAPSVLVPSELAKLIFPAAAALFCAAGC